MSTEYLQHRYFGFFAALRRFRTTTVIGWGVSAAGLAGFIGAWGIPGARGLLDVLLAGATILAGVAVVQVSVMSLQSYVSLRYPPLPPDISEADRAALESLEPVMAAVRDGGWQDAFHAIGEVRAIGRQWGLPPPDHASHTEQPSGGMTHGRPA